MILLNEKKYNIFCEKDKINFNLNKKLNKLIELKKEYEEEINFEYMKCPNCGCDKLIGYGSYERNVGINDKFIVIKIKRVQCKNCRRTHALIPPFIKAHYVFESTYIDFLILLLKLRKKQKRELERILKLSRQLIRKWEKRFEKYEIYIKTTFEIIKKKKLFKLLFEKEFNKKFIKCNKIRYFSKIVTT